MDRGAWQATVHGIAKSQTQLKHLSTQTCHIIVTGPLQVIIITSTAAHNCPYLAAVYKEFSNHYFIYLSEQLGICIFFLVFIAYMRVGGS